MKEDSTTTEENESNRITKQTIIGAVARGWTHPENGKKIMDEKLAMAIVAEIMTALEMVDDEIISSVKVEPLNLDEKLAAILMEDIHATSDGRLVARQAPLSPYPDDSDSWRDVRGRYDLLYVAQTLIKVVTAWHLPPLPQDSLPSLRGQDE